MLYVNYTGIKTLLHHDVKKIIFINITTNLIKKSLGSEKQWSSQWWLQASLILIFAFEILNFITDNKFSHSCFLWLIWENVCK